MLLATAVLLQGCSEPAAQAPETPPPPLVSVAAALERAIVDTEEYPGHIEAIERVEVRARVTGYLQSFHFRPGAEVRKGELLFQIDPRPFEAEVARAQALVASTQAQLALARIERTRSEKLFAERATSRRELDDAATRVQSLEAQLAANQAALRASELDLSYTRVTAPISGRVGKAEITVGNLIQGAGANSPLLTTMVSVDPIYVSFEVEERAYLRFATAARARNARLPVAVGLADEQEFPHMGKLEFVDNRVDPSTGTARLRAVLDNKDGRLAPGLYARVRIGDASRPRKAVLVSDRAIGTDQSKRFVLVVGEGNTAEYREVSPGRLVDGLRVINAGLQPGELVVVNGLQRVRPNMPLTPQVVPMAQDTPPSAARRRMHMAATPESQP
jgi:multidrug efflux system membrane fusion protein